jgi:hypothetical protein
VLVPALAVNHCLDVKVQREMTAIQKMRLSCVVRLDRLVVSDGVRGTKNAPVVEGFRVVGDTRVKPQSDKATYSRLRRLRSPESSSQAFVQYQPKMPWLDAWRITAVGDDETGITPEEIQALTAKCASHRLGLVELAVDFDSASGVDEAFVSRYGRFGKSRRREDLGGVGQLRLGSRGSLKLVRCYQKEALDCFRVELELHSALLRKFGVKDCRKLYVVASKLIPSHLCFLGFRWKKLARSLTRRFGSKGADILREARRRRAGRRLAPRCPPVFDRTGAPERSPVSV